MARLTPLGPALALALVPAAAALAEPAAYQTPQAALEALIAALESGSDEAVLAVFGPENADIILTGNAAEDDANRNAVLEQYRAGYRFVPGPEEQLTLELGPDGWPFPIPLAQQAGEWAFDPVAGEAVMRSREIGLNELDVIALMDAYVDVQAEFRLRDHDGDGLMEFARSVIAEDGGRDGLYWQDGTGPLGAAIARAAAEGHGMDGTDHPPEPYLGYVFRILNAQGPAAPGGAMSYLVNGAMLAGHALLAVPASYGETGVHSFMVAENGRILEADLGEETTAAAAAITAYDPGPDWQPTD
ncbi:DUF2950 family protein [Mangrovicoccus algicola]|uniref:DUF2950 family protein n=1 Tax=Mangrovicoccus algicola TaxID=2771008 RepID=A0A8J6YXM1_9RHOB|nr:DUF2950 family protein [Mangrovicoccus algicola]MBE3638344.1 DUF2950 family protein [Mangrovicoccus algicola]